MSLYLVPFYLNESNESFSKKGEESVVLYLGDVSFMKCPSSPSVHHVASSLSPAARQAGLEMVQSQQSEDGGGGEDNNEISEGKILR